MWSKQGLLYVMMEVTAADMKRIRDKRPMSASGRCFFLRDL